MSRGLAVVVVALAACRAAEPPPDPPPRRAPIEVPAPPPVPPRPPAPPPTFELVTVSGTITDEAHAPRAGAQVCALTARDGAPTCVVTDASGRYSLGPLAAGPWRIGASAPHAVPRTYPAQLVLGAAATVDQIDITLRSGGAVVRGTLVDAHDAPLTGTVIASFGTAPEESGFVVADVRDGTFSVWVAPVRVNVHARAEGFFAPSVTVDLYAPARPIVLRAVAASSISGRVVDAAGVPVGGARVYAEYPGYMLAEPIYVTASGADGRYRIDGLVPLELHVVAVAPHARGTSAPFRIGFAQALTIEDVVLAPAARVTSRVTSSDPLVPCTEPAVSLSRAPDAAVPTGADYAMQGHVDGRVTADGMPPGRYTARVTCAGFAPPAGEQIVEVGAVDVAVPEWRVTPGVTLSGTMVTTSGQAVGGEELTISRRGASAFVTSTISRADGTYEVHGLEPGPYELFRGDTFHRPDPPRTVDVGDHGATFRFEVVSSGLVTVDVRDTSGAYLPGVDVDVLAGDAQPSLYTLPFQTDANGRVRTGPLASGPYRAFVIRSTAERSLLEPPRSNVVPVIVTSWLITPVSIVVPAWRGSLAGAVVDAAGQPVAGALVVARTDPSWDDLRQFAWTDARGRFKIGHVGPGPHALHAYVPGTADEALVAPATPGGKSARLVVAPVAVGTVTELGPIVEDH